MKKINLKDYYDHITTDTYINIPDKVFNIFEEYRKAEQAYQSKVYYHKAHYSLDRGDGIEPLVIEAIRELIKNEDFATEIKSKIGKQIDTSTLNRELKITKVNLEK